jgi:aldehyde:ferredoxin oxidoreductase
MQTTTAPWAGKILHIDLTTRQISTSSTLPHALNYLGGRGVGTRLAWDLIPPGTRAFDPANPLMFMVGALVGTPAPSSGRVTVSGLSPQAYPDEWYTRANLGGHWGAELKYAGYDGLVVTGSASEPIYIRIEDDRVELCDARPLWGLGLIETQRRLQQELSQDTRVVAIGPAGENRCRYAILATGTESAAGQGGFGAVMGSKNLKAITVRGHGGVRVAQPSEMLRRSRLVVDEVFRRYPKTHMDEDTASPHKRRLAPCTYQCPRSCGGFYQGVPGVVNRERKYTGQLFCCAPIFGGREWGAPKLGFEAGFEISQTANDLGINHWELIFGIVPWMLRCQQRGELRDFGGETFNWGDAHFWIAFMHKIATREGWGDLFAEGGPRIAATLGVGQDILSEYYPGWGQASHWDGHGSFPSPYFPYWLVTALQWAMDTRDPIGGSHGYTTNIVGLLGKVKPDDPVALQKLRAVGERLYGSASSTDPFSGYAGKAWPAILEQDRGALKDSLGVCDNIFPLLTNPAADDFLVSVEGVEGQFLEHYLFEAALDGTLARDEFYRVGTRIFTLERLLALRNWGRSRATDETIIAYLKYPEGGQSPFLGERMTLDVARFCTLLDEFYDLRGWDKVTARPTAETLRTLGMAEFLSALL